MYLDFKGQEAHDLISKSLESIKNGIRLLNIRQEGEDDKQTTIATVYMPAKQREVFLKKINTYLQENTRSKKPKNQPLINNIEDIKLAILESFWTDAKDLLPGETPEWIEIWLSHDRPEKVDAFNALLNDLQITFTEDEILRFPERTVVLAGQTGINLTNSFNVLPILQKCVWPKKQPISGWNYQMPTKRSGWKISKNA